MYTKVLKVITEKCLKGREGSQMLQNSKMFKTEIEPLLVSIPIGCYIHYEFP
jgi:hypothetical protein